VAIQWFITFLEGRVFECMMVGFNRFYSTVLQVIVRVKTEVSYIWEHGQTITWSNIVFLFGLISKKQHFFRF